MSWILVAGVAESECVGRWRETHTTGLPSCQAPSRPSNRENDSYGRHIWLRWSRAVHCCGSQLQGSVHDSSWQGTHRAAHQRRPRQGREKWSLRPGRCCSGMGDGVSKPRWPRFCVWSLLVREYADVTEVSWIFRFDTILLINFFRCIDILVRTGWFTLDTLILETIRDIENPVDPSVNNINLNWKSEIKLTALYSSFRLTFLSEVKKCL